MTFICFVVCIINPFLVISNLSKSYVIWFIICSATATINKMIVSLYCAGGGSWWYWWLHCVASIETHCPSLVLALLLLSMCSCLNCWRHQTSAVSIFTRTHSTDKYGVESIKDSSVLFNSGRDSGFRNSSVSPQVSQLVSLSLICLNSSIAP